MMYVDCKVGRFIETRWVTPITGAHVDRFLTRTSAIMRGSSGSFVVFADLEQATILPPEWIDRVVEMLRVDNGRIERNGMLLGGSATFAMQVERMIRQANNPARRTFREMNELEDWITPVLNPMELARFNAFRAQSNDALLAAERSL